MNPSVEDRLNSVVRAIGGVILPALPESAALAREQAMLAIGHIQIILAQLPVTAAFEAEEAADLHALGSTIATQAEGGVATRDALARLRAALEGGDSVPPGVATSAIQDAIDAVLQAMAEDGDAERLAAVRQTVLAQGSARARKDREWFSAMGFDAEFAAG